MIEAGPNAFQIRSTHQGEQDRFLGVKAIFGLLEYDGMRRIDDRSRHFFPAVGRETVHKNVVRLRMGRERFINLVDNTQLNDQAAPGVLLIHGQRRPGPALPRGLPPLQARNQGCLRLPQPEPYAAGSAERMPALEATCAPARLAPSPGWKGRWRGTSRVP